MSIELKNVTYTYSPGTAYEIHALKDINLSIPDGQFIGIIGHTGSGKSTLIQHFNALIRPTSGTITYNGEDIWGEKYDRRALRSEVGLVFQYPEHQLFENDVLSDVCFGPMNQGLSREEAEVEAKKALQHVGFKEKNFSKSPFELSGGQKKRVAIAGVLAMNPKILILDEPTAGLDPKGRDDILDQIAELHKVRGITIILVSHSMEDIAKYAERLIVVNDGEIAYDDAPKAVFAHYRELEAMGLAAPQITYIMHALKEKGLDVDVTATTVDEAKENILAVLRKCNLGKLSGNRQSVSDSHFIRTVSGNGYHSHRAVSCHQSHISEVQYVQDLRQMRILCILPDQFRTCLIHSDEPYRSQGFQSSRNLYRNGSLYHHT